MDSFDRNAASDSASGRASGVPGDVGGERFRRLCELAHGYSYSLVRRLPGVFRVDWATSELERSFRIEVGADLHADELLQLIPDGDRERVTLWVSDLLEGRSAPLEHRVIDARGATRWIHHAVHVEVLSDGPAAGLRIDGSAIDITHRKQAQEELAQSEERFRMIADQMSNLILELHTSGEVLFANPAVRKILGWDIDRVMGAKVGGGRGPEAIWMHPDDIAGAARKLRESHRTIGLKDQNRARFRHADGEWRWIEMAGNSFVWEDGIHTLLVGRDVTSLVEREEALRLENERLEHEVLERTNDLHDAYSQLRDLRSRLADAEKLAAADELAGSLAHAINNPLSALAGRLQMELELPTPTRHGLLPIRRLAERIYSVVTNTLALYREGRLRLEDTRVEQLFDDVRNELDARAKRSQITIRAAIDREIPPLWVDRTLLAAALVSIAENGIEAMPEGGVLELEARHRWQDGVVEFHITDQGAGISDEARDRIFDAFFTTKPSGTGLGLPIASGVVRGHRGRIEVGRRPEGGTRFCISIPYAELRAAHEFTTELA